MTGFRVLIVDVVVLVAAARCAVTARPPALVRPRKGSADLGDRDATPRGPREPADLGVVVPAREPWVVPAAWTAVAVTVGVAVRGAFALV